MREFVIFRADSWSEPEPGCQSLPELSDFKDNHFLSLFINPPASWGDQVEEFSQSCTFTVLKLLFTGTQNLTQIDISEIGIQKSGIPVNAQKKQHLRQLRYYISVR